MRPRDIFPNFFFPSATGEIVGALLSIQLLGAGEIGRGNYLECMGKLEIKLLFKDMKYLCLKIESKCKSSFRPPHFLFSRGTSASNRRQ